ncbi:hypothetical protein [Candidatus Blastococcus massiliensis]|uniref:hypothetical protein n=1 Tax=Candidatus Blastococcus massiliensis TaxID=1470358 RepID=UPI0004BB59AB|nr:hypothetical protein [Candidatus Blastococcus massiliensis]
MPFRFFFAYTDPEDTLSSCAVVPRQGILPDRWAPLLSPCRFTTWPAGWVRSTCAQCPEPPGDHCRCGLTVMTRGDQLARWLLSAYGRYFIPPAEYGRLAVARISVRGRLAPLDDAYLEHDQRRARSFTGWDGDLVSTPDEWRAEHAKVVELWLPAAAARFEPVLKKTYSVPVHVSALSGHSWLRETFPEPRHMALMDVLEAADKHQHQRRAAGAGAGDPALALAQSIATRTRQLLTELSEGGGGDPSPAPARRVTAGSAENAPRDSGELAQPAAPRAGRRPRRGGH